MRIEEETRIHVKNFASESESKIKFVQANHNFQNFGKNKAGNKRKFFEATAKNSGNSGMTSNSKKGKTYYNCGKKRHYKRECRFRKKQKQDNKNDV